MSAAGVLVDIGRATASFEQAESSDGSALISIEFDATTEETHDWQNTVTSSPVEEGGDVTDNILQNPKQLTLTGTITNAPIFSDDAPTSSIDDSDQETRVNKVFGLLSDLMDKGELMTVFTRYKVYSDMAITSINIPRTVGVGEAIVFTIVFLEIRIVSTQNVEVPAGISKKLDKKAGVPVQQKTMPQKNDGAVPSTDLNKSGAASISDGTLKGISGLISGIKAAVGLP